MMGHGIAALLLSTAAGYWVLERSAAQKGQLRKVGLLLGSLIVIGSLLAAAADVCYLGGRSECPLFGQKMGMKGMRPWDGGMNAPGQSMGDHGTGFHHP